MIAHVSGVPVEELLPLVPAIGAGAGLLLARARTAIARIARRPGRRRAGTPPSRSRSTTCAR
jgi:hypothetical protein